MSLPFYLALHFKYKAVIKSSQSELKILWVENDGDAMRTATSLERVISWDMDLCLWFNRASRYQGIKRGFALISWLGNGKFWYILMLMLSFSFGMAGLQASLHMAVVGFVGLLISKLIKSNTYRLRPYMANKAINSGALPLDQYSFPSGHTLHAVSFTIVIGAYFPLLVWALLPFTVLVVLSRVILGLH